MPIPSGPFPANKRHLLPGMIAERDDGVCFVISVYHPAAAGLPELVTASTAGPIACLTGSASPCVAIWTGEGDPNQRTMMWRRS